LSDPEPARARRTRARPPRPRAAPPPRPAKVHLPGEDGREGREGLAGEGARLRLQRPARADPEEEATRRATEAANRDLVVEGRERAPLAKVGPPPAALRRVTTPGSLEHTRGAFPREGRGS